MKIELLTIFPEMFESFLNTSILGRARAAGHVEIHATDIRPFSQSKHKNTDDYPFGGGAGGGVKVTPVAFLIVKEGNVRMLPVATPANTTADRIVEQIPDTLDKIAAFIDSRMHQKTE